jgi:hypothetical protein
VYHMLGFFFTKLVEIIRTILTRYGLKVFLKYSESFSLSFPFGEFFV